MPEENVELVRRLYEAWNRGDFERFREHLDPHVAWHPSGKFPGFREIYLGPDGVREFWDTMRESWASFTIDIERAVQDRNRVVTAVRFDAVGRTSGVRVELSFAHAWELEGGRIVRYSSYPSLDQALGAAGLRE